MSGFGSECDVKNPVHMDRPGFQELQRLLSNERASKLHEEILERDKTHTNWKQEEKIWSRLETFL
jgi:uncharacterized protein CbrC (UPF0167 family)